MYTSDEILKTINENISQTEKFHISKLALFGSFAREEQTELSDIDILVDFEDGHETFDNYMDLKFFLEELIEMKVDLVIFNSLKTAMKPSIMRSIKYAKGA